MDDFRQAGSDVPAAPREISGDMRADAGERGRFLRLFGAISLGVGGLLAVLFTILAIAAGLPPLGGFLGLAWVVAGLTLYLLGARAARRALRVYAHGAAASGEIVEVRKNLALRMNGKNPWEVIYRFQASSAEITGKARFWDDLMPEGRRGDRVSVVYDLDNPKNNALWTRVRGMGSPTMAASSGRRIGDVPETRVAEMNEAADAEEEAAAVEEAAAHPSNEGRFER